MVRGSTVLHLKGAGGVSKALLDIIVCPLSKQPLRLCQETQYLISDEIGVSFPVVDGIPCLVPKDGRILDEKDNMRLDKSTKEPITDNNMNKG
ncbi:hypothetical protein AXF42_Ash014677 [Apostasia shenzhenica]|uniref:Protein preY, mitochondrial n=1 Tax=Apostasia shenzhenica TaxID=1088818 RepID=A0A2I0AKG1_9ASPA|nr:hypothetical protein AXF42_Ash014677 [Apostasia shenzhenica]